MRLPHLLLALVVLASSACHPGPVIGGGSKPLVDGTIAGIVLTDTQTPVSGRKVSAVNTQTGVRFDATTGLNGGYTIKVPPATYRLEIALQPGETVSKQPAETRINSSDLDPHRDFVIAIKPVG
jgi:hypothetical protein